MWSPRQRGLFLQHKNMFRTEVRQKQGRPTATHGTLNGSTPSHEHLTCKSDLHDIYTFLIKARVLDLPRLMSLCNSLDKLPHWAWGKQRITGGDGGLSTTAMGVLCTTCDLFRNAPATRPQVSSPCQSDLLFAGIRCCAGSCTTILACRPARGLDVGLMHTAQVEDTVSNTPLTRAQLLQYTESFCKLSALF